MRWSCVEVRGRRSWRRLDRGLTRNRDFGVGVDLSHLNRERFGPSAERVAEKDIGAEQNHPGACRDRPDRDMKSAAGQRDVLASPVRRQVFDCLGLGPPDRLVKIATDGLQRARPARRSIDALKAKTEARVHDFEQTKIDCGVLLGAVEFLEESHAAHPLVEEPDQHAVLGPYPTVLARQILHDVVGAGGERVFGCFDLIARSAAARASISNC